MAQIVLADALLHAERLFARKEAAVDGSGADPTRLTYGEFGALPAPGGRFAPSRHQAERPALERC